MNIVCYIVFAFSHSESWKAEFRNTNYKLLGWWVMTKMLVVDRVEGRLYSYPEIFAPKNEGSRPLFLTVGGAADVLLSGAGRSDRLGRDRTTGPTVEIYENLS